MSDQTTAQCRCRTLAAVEDAVLHAAGAAQALHQRLQVDGVENIAGDLVVAAHRADAIELQVRSPIFDVSLRLHYSAAGQANELETVPAPQVCHRDRRLPRAQALLGDEWLARGIQQHQVLATVETKSSS